MKANELLAKLEAVDIARSIKEFEEQSSDFVFDKGHIICFNGDILASVPSGLDIQGAVSGSLLLNYLTKAGETELTLKGTDGFLEIKGKNQKAKIEMDETIRLPYGLVDNLPKWKKLPEGYIEHLSQAAACTTRDEAKFDQTCVSINKQNIQATDGNQLIHIKAKLDIDPCLVRYEGLSILRKYEFVRYTQTDKWLFFGTKNKFKLACRTFINEDYVSFAALLKTKGTKFTFPKALVGALDRANLFTKYGVHGDGNIRIDIKDKKIRISGRGDKGTFQEVQANKGYKGPERSFYIKAHLLKLVIQKYEKGEVSGTLIKITGPNFIYIVSTEVD